MRNRLRGLLTFANVVSILALAVALSGGAYAVVIGKNSVGAAQIKKDAVRAAEIKKNAVRSAEVKDATLRAADFKAGELPDWKVTYRRADTGPLAQGAFGQITVGCQPGEQLVGGGAGWPFVGSGIHDRYQQLATSGPGILLYPETHVARAIQDGETPDVWFASGYQAEVNPHTLAVYAICAAP